MSQLKDFVILGSDAENYLTEQEKQVLISLMRQIHERKSVSNLHYLYDQLESLRLELVEHYGLTDDSRYPEPFFKSNH